ncbi:rRNA maturation RNase YbeY [Fusibacillus kribbianus]|uniref:Endoribonuclease YbeY n=1 Tax=Fusibacillus kribbianus TaxID=3044208 RepID=A0AAP4BDW8_9FIRM|nr:rRNA maturation RNase YbeY [Ruminococcus sp. YH-rum2234]MDI9242584.1 rRNA maturation RNase YbeY [Ruminococcus sp. YH-rum2234]
MTCEISYEASEPLSIPYEEIIRAVVDAALLQENCPYEAEVSVTLTDADEVQRINREFRGIDRTTDVLSFPMAEYVHPADFDFLEEDDAFDCFNPETGELLLGDIILSVEKIKEQAEEFGHSLKRELAFLTAHSMLHLMGYDHMEEEDRILMEEHQRHLMETLNIPRE